LKLLADLSQAAVAVAIAYVFVRAAVWLFTPVRHRQTLLGSSAEIAAKHGGTKTAPMQA
jgi:hypothetical protein